MAVTSVRRGFCIRIAICPNISPRPSRHVCPAACNSTAPEAMKCTFRAGVSRRMILSPALT